VRLDGKVCIVTGAGSGIGRATALRFAQEGARLVVNDLRPEYLARLAGELGGGHEALAGDVALEETAERLAGAALERFGRIDVLVNNAAVHHIGDIDRVSSEEFDRIVRVNLKSMFFTCKHVIPTMVAQRSGSIVNLASNSAFIGQEMGEPVESTWLYNVTKAGVRQLSVSLATRYAADGIRVNSVCPGAVRTQILRHEGIEDDEPIWEAARVHATPLLRVAEPAEIAAAILFLASDESSFVTGAPLIVDGGSLAR
jgi:NAD(P)-dependent dehydrogenase (short-subunit alcohol dehydrogenase family)